MTQLLLTKNDRGSLTAADDEARGFLRHMRRGQVVMVSVRLPRNAAFHRRAFSMFKFLFDHWEPPATNGAVRDFDSFRKQLTVAAGFHKSVVRLDGSVVLEPLSMAWDSMSEDRFQACVDAITEIVSNGYIPGLDSSTLEQWAREYEAAA